MVFISDSCSRGNLTRIKKNTKKKTIRQRTVSMNAESIPFLLFDISISKEHSLKIMSLEHTVNYNLITTQNRADKIKIQETQNLE